MARNPKPQGPYHRYIMPEYLKRHLIKIHMITEKGTPDCHTFMARFASLLLREDEKVTKAFLKKFSKEKRLALAKHANLNRVQLWIYKYILNYQGKYLAMKTIADLAVRYLKVKHDANLYKTIKKMRKRAWNTRYQARLKAKKEIKGR